MLVHKTLVIVATGAGKTHLEAGADVGKSIVTAESKSAAINIYPFLFIKTLRDVIFLKKPS